MPIVGNLSEFPLPEVLLLIGQRTGRLRLLDIPEFGILEVDISNGAVQTMRIGRNAVTEISRMIDKLAAVLRTSSGMFDFQLMPVSLLSGQLPVTIHELAMKLVCHVDQQAAEDSKASTSGLHYRLLVSNPDIWMEPELDLFFCTARPFLASASSVDELACHLQMEPAHVHDNLTKLRQLEIVELIGAAAPAQVEERTEPTQEMVEKSNAYFRVAQMNDQIRKLTSRLPAI